MKQWDIFCKVVDNFGDIGVCWRLAKQLVYEHGLQVRMFVDDLKTARQVIPTLQFTQMQLVEEIEIQHWKTDSTFERAADVVIEAFACELPQDYLSLMSQDHIWVNLEYLSAEPWVESFHGGNSRFSDTNLKRHFFFPGFGDATGGLLREHDLLSRRDRFLATQAQQSLFWQQLGVNQSDSLKISLFNYTHAPLSALFHKLSSDKQKITLLAPVNACLQRFSSIFDRSNLAAGDQYSVGSLTLQVLPFLSQDDYDKLLWACDANVVRGEDSWIRAVWAGKPFIWQPYPQTENTHLAKLNAFLDAFYVDGGSVKKTIADAHLAWSTGELTNEVLDKYLSELTNIEAITLRQSGRLAEQTDLAAKLVIFCKNLIT